MKQHSIMLEIIIFHLRTKMWLFIFPLAYVCLHPGTPKFLSLSCLAILLMGYALFCGESFAEFVYTKPIGKKAEFRAKALIYGLSICLPPIVVFLLGLAGMMAPQNFSFCMLMLSGGLIAGAMSLIGFTLLGFHSNKILVPTISALMPLNIFLITVPPSIFDFDSFFLAPFIHTTIGLIVAIVAWVCTERFCEDRYNPEVLS